MLLAVLWFEIMEEGCIVTLAHVVLLRLGRLPTSEFDMKPGAVDISFIATACCMRLPASRPAVLSSAGAVQPNRLRLPAQQPIVVSSKSN